MYRSWSGVKKLSPIIFWKVFFEDRKILYKIYSLQKKLFKKIIGFSFLTLDHDLCISSTCYNYFLCSFDPGESTGNNYSIIWVTKNILTREKHIFSVLSKSDVDEAQIQVEISTIFDWFSNFKTVWRSQKWSKSDGKKCVWKLRHWSF